MPREEAGVIPYQPWKKDGNSNTTPFPPYPDNVPKIVPVENRVDQVWTVTIGDYPNGLVLVREANPPPKSEPTVLPMKTSSSGQVEVDLTDHGKFPNGAVVLFH